MHQLSLGAFRFYFLQRFREQPRMLALLCLAALAVAAASLLLLLQAGQRTAGLQQLRTLERSQQAASRRVAAPPTQVADALTLPYFDGATFVATFNTVAAHAALRLDEVVYSLDSRAAQPFQRYRVTLSAEANYPAVRQFIAELSTTLPNVSLDAVSCKRESVATAKLKCDLAFSAFFRRGHNG